MRIFKLSAMDCGGFWPAGKGKHLDTQMFPECKNWPSYQHKGKKKAKKAGTDESLHAEAARLRCSNCGHPVLRKHRSGRDGLYECTSCGLAVSTDAIPYEGSWAHSEEVRKREGKPVPGAELHKLPSEGDMRYPLAAVASPLVKTESYALLSPEWYNTEVARTTKDPEILRKILEMGHDDLIFWNAIQNRNCPSDMLVKILEKGNDDAISRAASRNSNCPLEAKINWMRLTGKI